MVDTANTAWQRKVFCRDWSAGFAAGKYKFFLMATWEFSWQKANA